MNPALRTPALAAAGASVGGVVAAIPSSVPLFYKVAFVVLAIAVGTVVGTLLVTPAVPQRRIPLPDNRYRVSQPPIPRPHDQSEPLYRSSTPAYPTSPPPAPAPPPPAPPRQPPGVQYAVHPLDRAGTDGTGGWWNQDPASPAGPTGPTAPTAPRREAPELGSYLESAVVAQCPNCGEFRVDVAGHGDGYAFGCPSCAHEWSWAPGEPWPAVRVDPRRRTARPRVV